MTGYEYRRFAPGQSAVSTFEFHEHRERAPHLEQPIHQQRLHIAAGYVIDFAYQRYMNGAMITRVIDLGCGDGGLLSLIKDQSYIEAFGYDFQPSNTAGWADRGVTAYAMNFIDSKTWHQMIPRADLYVMTEVLEHLEDPHGMVDRVFARDASLVCSSPWMEHEGNIDACHAWAWDMPGYVNMIETAGFHVDKSQRTGIFQVHRALHPKGIV